MPKHNATAIAYPIKGTFQAKWSGKAYWYEHKRMVEGEFFHVFNGYNQCDQENIRKLKVGQIWKSAIYGDDHTVTRIS